MADDFGESPIGGDPVQRCPDRKKKHWIEIQLKDEEEQPVANEEYLVTLTDGQEVRGFLDGDGSARFELLDNPGNCKVRFPNIDAEAWSE